MKKALIASLLLLTVTFVSACNTNIEPERTQTKTDASTSELPTENTSKETVIAEHNDLYCASSTCYYNNLYFSSAAVEGESIYTLKYIDFSWEALVGEPVIKDLTEGQTDPFSEIKMHHDRILIDEEATKNNNGIPVLIVAHNVTSEYSVLNTAFFTVNTATGQTAVLYDPQEDLSNDLYNGFALCGDYIYFSRFLGNKSDYYRIGDYGYYRLPKSGGDPERLPFPIEETRQFAFRYSYGGKLYLQCNETGKVYRCNPDLSDIEIVWQSELESVPHFYADGYVYFKSNFRAIPQNQQNKTFSEYFDYCRKPIGRMSEDEFEVVLKDIVYVLPQRYPSEDMIYYEDYSDFQVRSQFPLRNILHSYNLKTGENDVVYDYSDQNEPRYIPIFCSNDYLHVLVYDHPEYKGNYIINRKTGEVKKVKGIWIYHE